MRAWGGCASHIRPGYFSLATSMDLVSWDYQPESMPFRIVTRGYSMDRGIDGLGRLRATVLAAYPEPFAKEAAVIETYDDIISTAFMTMSANTLGALDGAVEFRTAGFRTKSKVHQLLARHKRAKPVIGDPGWMTMSEVGLPFIRCMSRELSLRFAAFHGVFPTTVKWTRNRTRDTGDAIWSVFSTKPNTPFF